MRRHVDHQFVDQPGLQGVASQGGTTLDQDFIDLAPGQRAQQRRQINPSAQLWQAQNIGAHGTQLGLGFGCGTLATDQQRLAGQTQHARTWRRPQTGVEHDPQRLAQIGVRLDTVQIGKR